VNNEQEEKAFDTARFHYITSATRESLPIHDDQRITQPVSPRDELDSSSLPPDDTQSFGDRACPECDGHLLQSETSSPNDQLIYVNIDSVAQFDQLIIETEKSTYIFTVGDPTMHWGRLTGGVLGNRLLAAYLVPSEEELDSSTKESLIAVGNKVRFMLESECRIKWLVTSNVTRLVHINSGGGQTTPLKGVLVDSERASINTVGLRN
jgi:hypothetical protein